MMMADTTIDAKNAPGTAQGDDNTNLQAGNIDVSMQASGDDAKSTAGAAPEDTAAYYQRVIDAQAKAIDALTEQVESANRQIERAIRLSGAKVDDVPSQNTFANSDPTKEEGYISLADLGKEIGKRD